MQHETTSFLTEEVGEGVKELAEAGAGINAYGTNVDMQ